MNLVFEEMLEEDIPKQTEIMTRAFDDDSQRHLGVEKGGPPGYDDGEFFRTWLLPYKESIGYNVLLDGTLIGGIIVWILPKGENNLGTIFVDPEFQNKGIGYQIWQFIEKTYPNTKSWTLGTPSWAISNHHFYKKCGFTKIREEPMEGHPGTSFIYQKIISQ
ncbi:MAG: GNAT family N-acetyltransferase [Candidatus Hodarchaeales archaeon]|jgi:GNAT superfamily N-acetyltransferase